MRRRGVWARYLYAVTVGSLAVSLPAQAARPAPIFGGNLTYRPPEELRVVGRLQYGLTDMVGIVMTVGPTVLPKALGATAAIGPVLSFDVYTWVPRVYAVAGIDVGPMAPIVQIGAELQRLLSLHTGVVGGLAAEWSGKKHWGVLATLGFTWEH